MTWHTIRKTIAILAVMTLLVGSASVALPAGAMPPKCEENPEAPGCEAPVDDQPMAGTTCEAIPESVDVFSDVDVTPTEDGFDVSLTGDACIDVIATEGDWTVDVVKDSGTLRWLSLVIRDSVAPGDACDSVSYRKAIPSEITLDGFEGDNSPGIAGAWVNSCGTEWAEWVGDVYYAEEDQSVPSPLVFLVFMSGKNAEVTLSVTLP